MIVTEAVTDIANTGEVNAAENAVTERAQPNHRELADYMRASRAERCSIQLKLNPRGLSAGQLRTATGLGKQLIADWIKRGLQSGMLVETANAPDSPVMLAEYRDALEAHRQYLKERRASENRWRYQKPKSSRTMTLESGGKCLRCSQEAAGSAKMILPELATKLIRTPRGKTRTVVFALCPECSRSLAMNGLDTELADRVILTTLEHAGVPAERIAAAVQTARSENSRELDYCLTVSKSADENAPATEGILTPGLRQHQPTA